MKTLHHSQYLITWKKLESFVNGLSHFEHIFLNYSSQLKYQKLTISVAQSEDFQQMPDPGSPLHMKK
jgi:hypothetical protein